MGKSVLKVKGYSASDIKKLLTANESFKIGVGLYIVYPVALGHSSRKLAEQYQVSFEQITNWMVSLSGFYNPDSFAFSLPVYRSCLLIPI